MCRLQLTTFQKTLWVACLIVTLVFIQGVRLHMHVYSHDPVTSDHTHQLQAHVDYNVPEKEHPDETGQIDLSQKGGLKKLPLGSLTIALFAAVLCLLPRRLCSQLSWRLLHFPPPVSRVLSLRPPLRAPPL